MSTEIIVESTETPTPARKHHKHSYSADKSKILARLRRIDPQGNVTTLVGSDTKDTGILDGPKATARLSQPFGLGIDKAGVLYFVDSYVVRQLTPAGEVSTVAGVNVYSTGTRNGDMLNATFLSPFGLAVTEDGAQIIVTDLGFQQVRIATAPTSRPSMPQVVPA